MLIKNCGRIQNLETEMVHEKEKEGVGRQKYGHSDRINLSGIPTEKAAFGKVGSV